MELTRFTEADQRELVEANILQAEREIYGAELDIKIWEQIEKGTPEALLAEVKTKVKTARFNLRMARAKHMVYTAELARLPEAVPEIVD